MYLVTISHFSLHRKNGTWEPANTVDTSNLAMKIRLNDKSDGSARARYSWIATQVLAKMLNDNDFPEEAVGILCESLSRTAVGEYEHEPTGNYPTIAEKAVTAKLAIHIREAMINGHDPLEYPMRDDIEDSLWGTDITMPGIKGRGGYINDGMFSVIVGAVLEQEAIHVAWPSELGSPHAFFVDLYNRHYEIGDERITDLIEEEALYVVQAAWESYTEDEFFEWCSRYPKNALHPLLNIIAERVPQRSLESAVKVYAKFHEMALQHSRKLMYLDRYKSAEYSICRGKLYNLKDFKRTLKKYLPADHPAVTFEPFHRSIKD